MPAVERSARVEGAVPVKILIADDHELFRDGLRLVLSELDPDLSILEASSYDDALKAVEGEGPFDLVLVDLVMPGKGWQEGLAALKTLAPETPAVILSANEDRKLVLEGVRLGAAGFIPKTSSSKVMISALKLVLSGGVYLPTALLDADDGPSMSARRLDASPMGGDPGMGGGGGGVVTPLTPRQKEVLALLGQGKSNKEIARVLNLSEGTVKLHVTAILKALGANNRTGAVVAAQRLGLSGTA